MSRIFSRPARQSVRLVIQHGVFYQCSIVTIIALKCTVFTYSGMEQTERQTDGRIAALLNARMGGVINIRNKQTDRQAS